MNSTPLYDQLLEEMYPKMPDSEWVADKAADHVRTPMPGELGGGPALETDDDEETED